MLLILLVDVGLTASKEESDKKVNGGIYYMKNKNRLMAFSLAVIMIISSIPVSVFGENDTVEYSIKKSGIGIMNKAASESDLFRSTYLRSTDDNFNLVYKFNRTAANNVKGASDWLSYNTSMMHIKDGDYWRAYYE